MKVLCLFVLASVLLAGNGVGQSLGKPTINYDKVQGTTVMTSRATVFTMTRGNVQVQASTWMIGPEERGPQSVEFRFTLLGSEWPDSDISRFQFLIDGIEISSGSGLGGRSALGIDSTSLVFHADYIVFKEVLWAKTVEVRIGYDKLVFTPEFIATLKEFDGIMHGAPISED